MHLGPEEEGALGRNSRLLFGAGGCDFDCELAFKASPVFHSSPPNAAGMMPAATGQEKVLKGKEPDRAAGKNKVENLLRNQFSARLCSCQLAREGVLFSPLKSRL